MLARLLPFFLGEEELGPPDKTLVLTFGPGVEAGTLRYNRIPRQTPVGTLVSGTTTYTRSGSNLGINLVQYVNSNGALSPIQVTGIPIVSGDTSAAISQALAAYLPATIIAVLVSDPTKMVTYTYRLAQQFRDPTAVSNTLANYDLQGSLVTARQVFGNGVSTRLDLYF